MLVCGNGAISPNEFDATQPPYIDKTSHNPAQDDSIIDASEKLQGPWHPSNTNSSP